MRNVLGGRGKKGPGKGVCQANENRSVCLRGWGVGSRGRRARLAVIPSANFPGAPARCVALWQVPSHQTGTLR